MEHKAFIELVRGAIDKLETQGEPSYGPKGCAYLDPNGRCCVVGFMMPDGQRPTTYSRCELSRGLQEPQVDQTPSGN